MKTPDSQSPIPFEVWKQAPSADTPLSSAPLLGAMVFGKLTITSEQGSTIHFTGDFHVDASGVVTSVADLGNIPPLGEDITPPTGEVTARFFRLTK